MLADNVVLIGADKEAGMLVADEFNRGTQLAQVVDVGRVGVQGSRKGLGLVAGGLGCVVKDVFDLWVCLQHIVL